MWQCFMWVVAEQRGRKGKTKLYHWNSFLLLANANYVCSIIMFSGAPVSVDELNTFISERIGLVSYVYVV